MKQVKKSKKTSEYFDDCMIFQAMKEADKKGKSLGREELETVVLDHNIEKYGLKKGNIGTIVHVYEEGKVLEVEFITAKGKTVYKYPR